MHLFVLAMCILGDTQELHWGHAARDPASDFFSHWTPTEEQPPATVESAHAHAHGIFSDYFDMKPSSIDEQPAQPAQPAPPKPPTPPRSAITAEERALFADAMQRAAAKDGGATPISKLVHPDQQPSQAQYAPVPVEPQHPATARSVHAHGKSRTDTQPAHPAPIFHGHPSVRAAPSTTVATTEHIDVHLKPGFLVAEPHEAVPALPHRSMRTTRRSTASSMAVQVGDAAREAPPPHAPAIAADKGSTQLTHSTGHFFSSEKTVRDVAADAPTVYTKKMIAQLSSRLQTVGDVLRATSAMIKERLQRPTDSILGPPPPPPPPPPPGRAESTEAHRVDFPIDVIVAWQMDSFHHAQLRYVLRSVAQYAPWFRHIYVIVPHAGSRRPTWFRPSVHVTFVEHSAMFPASARRYLPTANEFAVACYLDLIPGVAEHFIYLNAGMFFGAALTPSDFYTRSGLPKVGLQSHKHRQSPLSPIPLCCSAPAPPSKNTQLNHTPALVRSGCLRAWHGHTLC
jgi:hypothetical protein